MLRCRIGYVSVRKFPGQAMNPEAIFCRYQELQRYVGWQEEDARRVGAAAALLNPGLPALIDDFYCQINLHPAALKVITGGPAQIDRLKGTLLTWLGDLLAGPYDRDYACRRWQVGWRHVEIGLDQVYTNVALSRLRGGLLQALEQNWEGAPGDLSATRRSLNTLLDLDLALIEDAYQTEHRARLQRAERLAAIGQVAGGIAHELRNPLNVIKTSVYYLLNARNPTPEKKAEHLARVERHVVLADNVITALANFAKMPVPNMQAFQVRLCLDEALEASVLPDEVQVTIDCPPDLPPALGDADQIRIVLSNLIRNAREAMAQGGRLTLGARQVGPDVEVAVTDTGVGIPPEQLGRIMEPLYSTKARGLGLGLALARAILDKNQGRLRIVSEPGRGSTFTVQLKAVLEEENR
jgi:two-component system, NtrC family, sensor kinase